MKTGAGAAHADDRRRQIESCEIHVAVFAVRLMLGDDPIAPLAKEARVEWLTLAFELGMLDLEEESGLVRATPRAKAIYWR